MTGRYLVFILADRLFSVELAAAKEIFPWRSPRPVPLSYSYVEGLLDYRGMIYPVLNTGQLLGVKRTGPIGFASLQPAAPLKGRSIILLEDAGRFFGIAVDGVASMATIETPQDAPPLVPGVDPKYVRAVLKLNEHDVILIHIERLFHAS